MAYTIVLDDIPDKIVKGDSYSWQYDNTDFPYSSSWRLTYSLAKSGTRIQINATAATNGTGHLVEISGTTTGAYTAGEYDWQAHITNNVERYLVGQGVIEIVADLAAGSGGTDARTHNKIMLDAIEAALEGRASSTQLEQRVGEVQVRYMTFAELSKARDFYYTRYRQELVRDGKATSRHITKVRFV